MLFLRLKIAIIYVLFRNACSLIVSSDVSRFYCVGFILVSIGILQIISGIFVGILYVWTGVNTGFWSIICIWDVSSGWALRVFHSVGTSFIFGTLFLHLLKALFNAISNSGSGGFTVWISGWFMLALILVVSFLGYVLPLSSMSYWGLTVFSNVVTTVPVVGEWFCIWLWGSEFVSDFTVRRCLILHIFIPGLIIWGSAVHVWVLHFWAGSDGLSDRGATYVEKVWFINFFLLRDLCALVLVCLVFSILGISAWWWWFHEEMWIPVNVLVTSEKVVPEWFVISFFGLLKSIPVKGVGFLAVILWFAFTVILLLFISISNFKLDLFMFTYWTNLIFIWVFIGICGGVVLLVYPVVCVLQVLILLTWVIWILKIS